MAPPEGLVCFSQSLGISVSSTHVRVMTVSHLPQALVSTIDFDDGLAGACDLGMPDFLCTAVPTPPPAFSSVKEAFTRG